MTVIELNESESEVVRLVQQQAFGAEVRLLEDHKSFAALQSSKVLGSSLRESRLKALCPVLVSGLLRVGGRLQRFNLPVETKYPIIMPNKHHVTRLIIESVPKVVRNKVKGYACMFSCLATRALHL